jgi:hypothetical protein
MIYNSMPELEDSLQSPVIDCQYDGRGSMIHLTLEDGALIDVKCTLITTWYMFKFQYTIEDEIANG